MNKNIKVRVLKGATYMLKTKATIREIADYLGVSKSTVHKDLSERLKDYDESMYIEVNKVIDNHLKIRHIRGGEVTKRKYKKR